MFKYFLYILLSRKELRGIAWGLRHRPNDWINHVTCTPGLTHVIHRDHDFSIYKFNGDVGLLSDQGDKVCKLRWAEKKMLGWALEVSHKSYFTISPPPGECAA